MGNGYVGPQGPATRVINGSTLPATCTVGQVFVVPTGGSAGMYVCFTTDAWTLLDSNVSGEVTGSGTTNVLTKWSNGTGSIIADSLLKDDGTTFSVNTNKFTITEASGNTFFAGVLSGGSGPTTITDAAGKILSAALNTVGAAQGGTGVANNAASTIAISGNFATTFTVTGITGVTLPTTGTLLTTTGSGAGLSGVTLSATVPNTAPSSGQILAGNAGGTAYAPVSMSGDATLASTGALTLASTIVAGGPIGSATVVPIITYDAKGRLTAVSSAVIAAGIGGGVGADNSIPRADGAGGATLQSSGVLIDDSNNVAAGSGTASAPSYSFIAQTGLGWFRPGANYVGLGAGGNTPLALSSTGIIYQVSGGGIGWTSSATDAYGGGAVDLGLSRSSAGVLEINNGTPGTQRDLLLRNGTLSGQLSLAATGAAALFDMHPTTGTNAAYGTLVNTGGTAYFGLESSSAGNLVTGDSAYAFIIAPSSGKVIQFAKGDKSAVTATFSDTSATFAGALINTGITSDATHTDSAVCQDTTSHQFYAGSGAAGICLGTSSRRFKHSLSDIKEGLAEVLKLRPRNFRYKKGIMDDGVRLQYGLIAEEVNRITPNMVAKGKKGEINSVDYGALFAIYAKAFQDVVERYDPQIELLNTRLNTVLA